MAISYSQAIDTRKALNANETDNKIRLEDVQSNNALRNLTADNAQKGTNTLANTALYNQGQLANTRLTGENQLANTALHNQGQLDNTRTTQGIPTASMLQNGYEPGVILKENLTDRFNTKPYGYSNSGLIPGEIEPEFADDVVINAKKGEFVIPQEVVSYLGSKFFSDIISKARKALGVPDVQGAKLPNEPDAMGRMNKPMLSSAIPNGLAHGGVVKKAFFGEWTPEMMDAKKKNNLEYQGLFPAQNDVIPSVDFRQESLKQNEPAIQFRNQPVSDSALRNVAGKDVKLFDTQNVPTPTTDAFVKTSQQRPLPRNNPFEQEMVLSPVNMPQDIQPRMSMLSSNGNVTPTQIQRPETNMSSQEMISTALQNVRTEKEPQTNKINDYMASRGLMYDKQSGAWVKSPELERAVENVYRYNTATPEQKAAINSFVIMNDRINRRDAVAKNLSDAQARHEDAQAALKDPKIQQSAHTAAQQQKLAEQDEKMRTNVYNNIVNSRDFSNVTPDKQHNYAKIISSYYDKGYKTIHDPEGKDTDIYVQPDVYNEFANIIGKISSNREYDSFKRGMLNKYPNHVHDLGIANTNKLGVIKHKADPYETTQVQK